jgi:hypothetical protein
MKQRTVKTAVEALTWLHNNPHHIAGVEWSPRLPVSEHNEKNWSHAYYANYHEKIRIPAALCKEVHKHIKSNTRPFDTRMYMLTRSGKALIGA